MDWPWQYSFPPFFTLQPNEDTRKKQLDAWCDLILAYCKQNRLYGLDLHEAQNSDLFFNRKIDRKCSLEFVSEIIEELVRRSQAEWTASSSNEKGTKSNSSSSLLLKNRKCMILWHTLDEWAKLIYDYVNRNSLQNTVCTFYELSESSDTKREEFHKLDKEILRRALLVLQNQRKAELIQLDDVNCEYGVKFF
jgi:ESCRT-II complex subunit VPS25